MSCLRCAMLMLCCLFQAELCFELFPTLCYAMLTQCGYVRHCYKQCYAIPSHIMLPHHTTLHYIELFALHYNTIQYTTLHYAKHVTLCEEVNNTLTTPHIINTMGEKSTIQWRPHIQPTVAEYIALCNINHTMPLHHTTLHYIKLFAIQYITSHYVHKQYIDEPTYTQM